MGFLDSTKKTGEKLFRGSVAVILIDASVDVDTAKATDGTKNQAVQDYTAQQSLSTTALSAQVGGDAAKAFGATPDQVTCEKTILCCGSVEGTKSVDNQMSVNTKSEES